MRHIAKLCAEHLRIFSKNNGVKLKSGHSYELVAAFFGYNSKAAMFKDAFCSIEKLGQAKILVKMPLLFIEQRRECLKDLSSNLLETDKLCDELSAFLKQKFSAIFFSSWKHLAEIFTKEYLKKYSDRILPTNFIFYDNKASDIFDNPLNEFNIRVETSENAVKLIVESEYSSSPSARFHLKSIVVRVAINLQRIAGYIGYTSAEISLIDCSSETFSQTGAIQ